MKVQPWPPQVGWFSRVVVLLVASVAGPSVIVPGGWEALGADKPAWDSRAADAHGDAISNAAVAIVATALRILGRPRVPPRTATSIISNRMMSIGTSRR